MARFTMNALFCWATLSASTLAVPLMNGPPHPYGMPQGSGSGYPQPTGLVNNPTNVAFPSLATGTGFVAPVGPTGVTAPTGVTSTSTVNPTQTVTMVPAFQGPRQSSYQPYFPMSYAPQGQGNSNGNQPVRPAAATGTGTGASTGFVSTVTAVSTVVAPTGTSGPRPTGQ